MESADAPAALRALPSWLINQAAIAATRVVAAALERVDARRQHHSSLSALAEFGSASQADLGRRIGLDRSDMAALVVELEDRGLIARTPDPDDRRRNVVTMTPAGRRHLRRMTEAVEAAQDELLAGLAPADRATLVRLLGLIVTRSS